MPFKEDRGNASEMREGERQAGSERAVGFSARVFEARWIVVAGLCLLVAAALLLLGRIDAAFVIATIGTVAWFWNERNRLRPPGIEAEEKFRDEEEELEDRDRDDE